MNRRSESMDNWEDYPVREGNLTEMEYTPSKTKFSLWSPMAEEVKVMLYESGHVGDAYRSLQMQKSQDGTWVTVAHDNLKNKFYTFHVKQNGCWLGETPGIMAKAVGVNGRRAAILDESVTKPKGWEKDDRPQLKSFADMVIYEMHHRDFSAHIRSGIKHKGKFLALTEEGTINDDGEKTGIDHLKELGITHVHLLPSFDFASVDETHLCQPSYNWGYDPLNYLVPEGSYATDAYQPDVRIREFKTMIQTLHEAGIRVIMDVVYNHTYDLKNSNFQRTVPGYFYRHNQYGGFTNASGCGNETASERAMMRKFMVESVKYWVKEYHIDGFRFDLMGIHDIRTMNMIRKELDQIDPTIFIYGEGWAAEDPQLPYNQLAMKGNARKMPGIAVFSDEMRDGIRGPFYNDTQGAFLTGVPGHKMSVMYGLVGCIAHPQIDCSQVNHTQKPWAQQPTQMISYVSCHDDLCLADRVRMTLPKWATCQEAIKLQKLALTIVLTSQGIPFLFAGDELMRNKKGVRNSYNSPDEINAIDWGNKTLYREVFDYIKDLISIRKAHPAFRMGCAKLVRKQMQFLPVKGNNLLAFILKGFTNGDTWKNIIVAFNSRKEAAKLTIPEGEYVIVCQSGDIDMKGLGKIVGSEVLVQPQSALIMHQ